MKSKFKLLLICVSQDIHVFTCLHIPESIRIWDTQTHQCVVWTQIFGKRPNISSDFVIHDSAPRDFPETYKTLHCNFCRRSWLETSFEPWPCNLSFGLYEFQGLSPDDFRLQIVEEPIVIGRNVPREPFVESSK